MEEENSTMYKLEREIALRKVELDHQLEMRKQDLLEKELNLKAREMELRFIENDNLSKQRRVEEKKIDLQLRNWVEEENAQLDLHDYEPIYIKTSIYEAKIRQLSEIFEKIKKHCEIYDIDPTKYFYYDDLQKMVYEAKFVLEMNKSEENDKFDGLLEYEWDENSRDLLESLKDSEFFS